MISYDLKLAILGALKLDEWDISEATVASDVPGWDSLNHINVILAVESHFRVRFRGAEVLRLKTVGDLQRLVQAKLLDRG